MVIQMPTDKASSKKFIKVINREISDYLIASGFSYIKEGDLFVFLQSAELSAALSKFNSGKDCIIESKLRF